MANISIRINSSDRVPENHGETVEVISDGSRCNCWVSGLKGTHCILRKDEDSIASIGYVSDIDSNSMKETLAQILSTFNESQIGELKKKLIGQYVVMIKKGHNIYLFNDFLGVRNIFYSVDGSFISSSFSQIEDFLKPSPNDLDAFKVFEFLAMRHVLYPAWIGQTTENRKIKWLLPYEYLVVDLSNLSLSCRSIVYRIDNRKETDCSILSKELTSILKKIIYRREFKNSRVAASLTGGRDSRLVTAIASEQYRDMRCRIAVSEKKYDSLKDFEVSKKITRVKGIKLDVYRFKPDQDKEKFYAFTEGFAPSFNHSITPLINSSYSYELGFGGAFGTELFMPIQWNSIDDHIESKIKSAQKVLMVKKDFWSYFRNSLHNEFRQIKNHFQLRHPNDPDYIRLFNMINTVRYSSFILSAFNRGGYQLEPYGNYPVLDLALRVAPELWGNHKQLKGHAFVQIRAMADIDPHIAKVMTYSTFRPMLPFSPQSFPRYVIGYMIQIAHWLKEKISQKNNGEVKTELPGGHYLSNGWEAPFIRRTNEKYDLHASVLND